MHHEQRVVDRQAQPDQLDDVGDVEHHREVPGEQVDDAQGGGDGPRRHTERHQQRRAEPEDHEQQHEGDDEGGDLTVAQVTLEDRGEVVLERRRPRDQRGRETLRGKGVAQRGGVARGGRQGQGRGDVGVENAEGESLLGDGGAGDRPRGSGDGAGVAVALRPGVTWSITTVKVPSMFSPKWRTRMSLAAWDDEPGTSSDVVSSAGRRADASAPRTATTTQSPTTRTRQRMTARVQRSSTEEG